MEKENYSYVGTTFFLANIVGLITLIMEKVTPGLLESLPVLLQLALIICSIVFGFVLSVTILAGILWCVGLLNPVVKLIEMIIRNAPKAKEFVIKNKRVCITIAAIVATVFVIGEYYEYEDLLAHKRTYHSFISYEYGKFLGK